MIRPLLPGAGTRFGAESACRLDHALTKECR